MSCYTKVKLLNTYTYMCSSLPTFLLKCFNIQFGKQNEFIDEKLARLVLAVALVPWLSESHLGGTSSLLYDTCILPLLAHEKPD